LPLAAYRGRSDVFVERRGTRGYMVKLALIVVSFMTGLAGAQSAEIFKARLTALPVDAITAPTMRGSGTVTAELQGRTLSVSGEFSGLTSPATAAYIYRAAKGLRGNKVFDLTATKDVTGKIDGRLTLSDGQVADLQKSWYYVQLHTEANSDGQLRGWLLK
jgi:CHRD domain-containing protein